MKQYIKRFFDLFLSFFSTGLLTPTVIFIGIFCAVRFIMSAYSSNAYRETDKVITINKNGIITRYRISEAVDNKKSN